MKKILFTLTALLIVLISVECAYAQTEVYSKGNVKILQLSDGWQVVHGTKVIAYGDGTLDVGNLPPAFQDFLDSYSKKDISKEERIVKDASGGITWGPYVQTAWNQKYPYNNECPEIDGKHALTGCNTISTAQILNFYKYCKPLNESGKYSTSYANNISSPYFTSVNGANYNWKYNYTPNFDLISNDYAELAKFIVGIAFIQEGNFGLEVTTTDPDKQLSAFKEKFGYSCNTINISTGSNDFNIAASSIRNHIKKGRPVIYNGDNGGKVGHSFIIDGYDEASGFYHINYGWEQSSNGWFAETDYPYNITAIIPHPDYEDYVEMQQIPKYLHISGNGINKTINMVQNEDEVLSYIAENIELSAGVYEFYFEYPNGDRIAPYESSTIQLTKSTNPYIKRGGYIDGTANPAKFQLQSTQKLNFWHIANMNIVAIDVIDFEVGIYGKVLDANKRTIPNALISTSSPNITEQNNGTKTDNVCYVPSADGKYEFCPFNADKQYLTSIEFQVWIEGNPGNMDIIICNKDGLLIWGNTLSQSEIKHNDWTKVSLGNSLEVIPNQTYYIGFRAERGDNKKVFYGHFYDSQNVLFHRIWSCDDYVAATDENGVYIYPVDKNWSGTLHAYYDNKTFNKWNFITLSKSVDGIDFLENGEDKTYKNSPEVGTEFEYNGLYYKVTRENTVDLIRKEELYANLTKADIPEKAIYDDFELKVTGIGDNAFKECRKLQKVTGLENIVSIGEYAFAGCWNLEEVSTLKKIETLGKRAFYRCAKLRTLSVPTTLTSIGEFAFAGNTTVIADKNSYVLQWISDNSPRFTVMTKNSISEEESDSRNIDFFCETGWTQGNNGEEDFMLCAIPKVNNTTYPYGMTRFGCWCTAISQILYNLKVVPTGSVVYKYKDVDATVNVDFDSEQIDFSKIVMDIDRTATETEKRMTSLYSWYCLAALGDKGSSSASDHYKAMLKEYYPVTTSQKSTKSSDKEAIENYILQHLNNNQLIMAYREGVSTSDDQPNGHAMVLDGIRFINGETYVHLNMGWWHTSDGWYNLWKPWNTAYINMNVDNFYLLGIEKKDLSPEIGEEFEYDGLYYKVTSDNIVKVINNSDLYAEITTADIPQNVSYKGYDFSVTAIDSKAFFNCQLLNDLTLPNTITTIGRQAFQGCHGLKSVVIPESVETIDSYAFHYCLGLQTIDVATSNTKYSSVKGVLYDKKQSNLICCPCRKTEIDIPNTVTSINSYAFFYSMIEEITIPSSITSIGTQAFYNSHLTQVTFAGGSKLKTINEKAFQNCYNLKDIQLPTSVTNLGNNVFYGSGVTAYDNGQIFDGKTYPKMSSSYTNSIYYEKLTETLSNLTGNKRDDIISIALSQVGYKAGANSADLSGNPSSVGSYSEMVYEFNQNPYKLNSQNAGNSWCAEFAWWCAYMADIPENEMPICDNSYALFYSPWVTSYTWKEVCNGAYTPQKGDIIVFTPAHTAIVETYSQNQFTIVHGNSSSQVKRSTIEIENGKIKGGTKFVLGIVKPNYKDNTELFEVTLSSNNKDYGTVSGTGKYEKGETVEIKATPKLGYQFVKWSDGNQDTKRSIKVEKDIILTAKFSPIQYAITYNLGGGELSYENPSTYTIETETFALSNPAKSGYEFLGWSGTDIVDVSKNVLIEKGNTGDREYIAQWKKIINGEHTIHSLVFIDSEAKDADEHNRALSMQEMTKFITDVSERIGYNNNLHSHSSDEFNVPTALAEIDNLDVATDDIVIFYYHGHGYNNLMSKWPSMHLSHEDDNYPNTYLDHILVKNELKKKCQNAKLVLCIADCCNSLPGQSADSQDGVKRNSDGIDNIKELFTGFDGQKFIMISASHQGQFGYSGGEIGAYLGHYLRKTINDYAATNNPTWEAVLKETQRATAAALSKYDSEPQYEITDITDDKPICISGRVLDKDLNTLENAMVSTATNYSESQITEDNGLVTNNGSTYVYFSGYTLAPFKPSKSYLTKVDFLVRYNNNPERIHLSILDANWDVVWEKTLEQSEVTNKKWTSVAIENGLKVTPGQDYYVGLRADVCVYNEVYYAYYKNNNNELQYRIWSNDDYFVTTDKNGSYSFPVDKYWSGTLHALYTGKTFNNLTFNNVTSSVSNKDFVENGDDVIITNEVKSIIVTPPTKTNYLVGEQFDDSGLKVTAIYEDGTTENVLDYELSGFSSSNAGFKTITVSYMGKTATFKVTVENKTHTITYIVDGEEYQVIENVVVGSKISYLDEPIKEGYTFSGWNCDYTTMPDEDIEIKGSFKINKYTISFVVDGETVRTRSYNYGAEITYSYNPTKTGYTFSGWDKELPKTMPAENITLTGSFIPNKHTITYKVDGKIYQTVENVAYNSDITFIDEPTKKGYTFGGWESSYTTMPNRDITINGYFEVNTHKVIYFVDGKEYESEIVEYGSSITFINSPAKEGYTFGGWNCDYTIMPDKDIEVRGGFAPNKHTITYYVNGDVYKTETYYYGHKIYSVSTPSAFQHTFSGWDKAIPETMPDEDLMVSGTLSANKYTITYRVDSEDYKVVEVEYDSEITLIDEPTKAGYTFSGWNCSYKTMPFGDITIDGSFEANKHTITCMVNDKVYKTYTYKYGERINISAPYEYEYSFSGWDKTIPETMPDEDLTISGTLSVHKYTITYIIDYNTYKGFEVEYGSVITLIDEPSKEGYTFSGWDCNYTTMPNYDIRIDGNFEANKHTITCIVNDNVYETYTYSYGERINISDPYEYEHSFSGWDKTIPETMPDEDLVISGTLTVNKHTITYRIDYETYKEFEVEYGSIITLIDEPTKEGYTFSGWNCSYTTMPNHNIIIDGSFVVNKHTITCIVNGKLFATYTYKFGDRINISNPYEYEHTFSGWDKTIPETMPNEDLTISGTLSVNKYTITYRIDYKTYKEVEVEYGSIISLINEPTKEGYTFSGWNSNSTTMPNYDIIIDGSFTANKHTITYKVDGVIIENGVQYVDYGSYIYLKSPLANDKSFLGWKWENNISYSIMPDKDIVVYGWKAKRITIISVPGIIDNGNSYSFGGNQKGKVRIEYSNGDTDEDYFTSDMVTYYDGKTLTVKYQNHDELEDTRVITGLGEPIFENNIRIWSYDKTIIVENATSEINVIDMSGRSIIKVKPESSHTEIPISIQSGIYIVKTIGATKKVFIK